MEKITCPVAETRTCSLYQTNQLINSISGRSCVSVFKIACFRGELTDVLLHIGTNFILMKSSPINHHMIEEEKRINYRLAKMRWMFRDSRRRIVLLNRHKSFGETCAAYILYLEKANRRLRYFRLPPLCK